MDTSKIRARRKAEREVRYAEYLKERAFFTQGLHDLAERKTTIEVLHESPYWEILFQKKDDSLSQLFAMARAVSNKNKPLIALILEEVERPLNLVWGDAKDALLKWIEKNGDQTVVELYKSIATYPSVAGLASDLIRGKVESHPLLIGIVQDERIELLELTAKFQEEHPEVEEKAGRKNAIKLQPVHASLAFPLQAQTA